MESTSPFNLTDKFRLWVKYFGIKEIGICSACKLKPICFSNFKIGKLDILKNTQNNKRSNLRPICQECYSSSKDEGLYKLMNEKYIKNLGYWFDHGLSKSPELMYVPSKEELFVLSKETLIILTAKLLTPEMVEKSEIIDIILSTPKDIIIKNLKQYISKLYISDIINILLTNQIEISEEHDYDKLLNTTISNWWKIELLPNIKLVSQEYTLLSEFDGKEYYICKKYPKYVFIKICNLFKLFGRKKNNHYMLMDYGCFNNELENKKCCIVSNELNRCIKCKTENIKLCN